MTFATLNSGPAIRAYWWLEIEGLRKRYGTLEPSWNPADSGTNRHIEPWLIGPPRIGEQRADPLNGRSEISQHSCQVLDRGNEITDLLSSASLGDKAFLTGYIGTGSLSEIVLDDTTDLPASGHLYIDRETFYYTTKDSAKVETGLYSQGSGSKTASGGSDVSLTSASLTEDNGHWEGAICVFTSGTNNGERRVVYRSTGNDPLSGTESEWAASPADTEVPNCLYFDPNDPLPAAVVATDTFELTQPPRRVRLTGASGATDDYWEGAVLTVVADPVNSINVGESRIVTAFNATTKVLTFNEPLPAPLDFASPGLGYATVDLSKMSVSGISRALYRSRAEEHAIVDKYGDYSPVEVTTRPMFIKNRRAWIYEGREGTAENEAKRRQGILSDVTLSADMRSYEFSVESMQRILSQKILQNPWTGTVYERPVWGGNVAVPPNSLDQFLSGIVPTTSEGDTQNVEVWRIKAKSYEAPRSRGNIRIGNEMIHYRRGVYVQTLLRGGGHYELRLGETDDANSLRQIWGYNTWLSLDEQGYTSFEIENWCAPSRGLMSRHCGKTSISQWAGGNPESDKWRTEHYRVIVPAFIEEHAPGDEIRDAIFCDDSNMSDFARIDMLVMTAGSASGSIDVGDVVTGDDSGAEGVVNNVYDDGTNCVVWVRREDSDSEILNSYMQTESVSTVGGWSADLSEFVPGDGKRSPARNNPINVLLALMLSGGGGTSPYDYLPTGWGLGLGEDDVDISGIEALRDKFFSSAQVVFAISEPTDFSEWSEQLMRSLAIFPYETTEGKISFAYMLTEAECVDADDGSMLVVDDDVIEAKTAPNWTSGRAPITKVEVKYNKNPCTSDWYGKLEVNFSRVKGTSWDYGRSEKLELSTLYVPDNTFERVNPRDPELPDLVSRFINPLWGRHTTFPAPVVQISVPYSYDSRIEIGDVVKLSHELLPNLRTGGRGFTNEYFQVVSKGPDTERGTCGLELWQIGVHDSKYGKTAPSAKVSSYLADTPSAGKSRIVLYTKAFGKQGYDPDAAYFAVGDEICILQPNGDPRASPVEIATVELVYYALGAAHYLQLDQNLSTTPSTGDIVSLPQYDSAASTRKAKNAFLAGNDNTLGSGGDAAFRYH